MPNTATMGVLHNHRIGFIERGMGCFITIWWQASYSLARMPLNHCCIVIAFTSLKLRFSSNYTLTLRAISTSLAIYTGMRVSTVSYITIHPHQFLCIHMNSNVNLCCEPPIVLLAKAVGQLLCSHSALKHKSIWFLS